MQMPEEMNEMKNKKIKSSNPLKEQPFSVPDKYFDDFYARLHVRLEREENILPEKKNRFVRYLKPALGLAASFALIFMLVYWPVKSFLPGYLAETPARSESTIEDETYYALIEKLDENSFFSLISESITNNSTDAQGFNDEELLSYISSNISDYEIVLQTKN
jgi:hypothetical protein